MLVPVVFPIKYAQAHHRLVHLAQRLVVPLELALIREFLLFDNFERLVVNVHAGFVRIRLCFAHLLRLPQTLAAAIIPLARTGGQLQNGQKTAFIPCRIVGGFESGQGPSAGETTPWISSNCAKSAWPSRGPPSKSSGATTYFSRSAARCSPSLRSSPHRFISPSKSH